MSISDHAKHVPDDAAYSYEPTMRPIRRGKMQGVVSAESAGVCSWLGELRVGGWGLPGKVPRSHVLCIAYDARYSLAG